MNLDIGGVKLFIAMPINRDLPWQTAKSLLDTTIELSKMGVQYEVQFLVGSSIVELARSKIAHAFMKSEMTSLFMIDSDQCWTVDDALRIIALSTKMDIVCGGYPTKQEPITYLFNMDSDPMDANEYGCLPINGCGLGFAIVSREVIKKVSVSSNKTKFPGSNELVPLIFKTRVDYDGSFVGEDIGFFKKCKNSGFQPWLDPKLCIGHIGSKEYKGDVMNIVERISSDLP